VRGLTEALSSALPAPLMFDENAGRVVVRLEGVVGPPEPSLVAILRAASVVASAAIDEFELLLFCAESDTSEPVRSELLWQMLTLSPVDLALDKRQTVVAILGGNIEPDDDYARRPDVRVVVRPDRILRRSQQKTEKAVRDIAAFAKPIVLFLGAGASATSGVRLGNVYRDQALRELLGQDSAVEGPQLEDLFFDWCHDQARFLPDESDDRTLFCRTLNLERVLRETFHALGPQPRLNSAVVREIKEDCEAALGWVRPGRRALRQLIDRLRGRVILLTVNFDQLIEHDFSGDLRVAASPEAFGQHFNELAAYLKGDATKPVPLLKLHGTIEEPDSLIATVDVTALGFHDEVRASLDKIVDVCELPLTWVWIGCSMRDQDVNAWLRGLQQDALDEWWVDPLPSVSLDAYFNDLRRAHWTQEGRVLEDRLIVDSADRFLDQLDKRFAATLVVP
jgi:hypothetical protein